MSCDGHTRLCAACNKIYFLPWHPGPEDTGERAWRCAGCLDKIRRAEWIAGLPRTENR